MNNYMWVEKYRPKHLNEVVLSDETNQQLEGYISDKEIPHLLFQGSPGSGKTTIARILVSYLIKDDSDVLVLNGSEQRGIDVVRNNIIEFLKYPPLNSKHKIIFIDESDSMTEQAFSALRRVFEEYYENGRFILTCNYVHKIPDAIRSRCSEYKFREMPQEFIYDRCKHILESENIKFSDDILNKIITSCYPDMRKIINNLQKFSKDGSLILDNDKNIIDPESTICFDIVDVCKYINKNDMYNADRLFNKIIQDVTTSELDYVTLYKKIFHNDETIPITKILSNKYLNNLNNCVFPNMHFVAFLYENIRAIKELNSLPVKTDN